jgi:hypothetical protein
MKDQFCPQLTGSINFQTCEPPSRDGKFSVFVPLFRLLVTCSALFVLVSTRCLATFGSGWLKSVAPTKTLPSTIATRW